MPGRPTAHTENINRTPGILPHAPPHASPGPGMSLAPFLDRFADEPLFIVYELRPKVGKPGTDKVPIDPITHYEVNAQDAAQRMPLAEAELWVAQGSGHGVGIVITGESGLFFLDLDHCREGDTWTPYAQSFLTRFPGAYVEVSSSHEGLHVIGSYLGGRPDHGTRNKQFRMELYTTGRFCALTGLGASGSLVSDHSAALRTLCADFFPPRGDDDAEAGWTTGPVSGWNGPTDDRELITRALRSQSGGAAFGGKASFVDLWNGTPDVMTRAFPSQGAGEWDGSGADLALANHLAFWTGNDCERIRHLMLQSGLRRDKWERPDYLPRTILRACSSQRQWYSGGGSAGAGDAVSVPSVTGQPADAATQPAPSAPAGPNIPPPPDSMPIAPASYSDASAALAALTSQLVFLKSDNKYFERSTRCLISPEALNRSEASRMPRKDDGSGGYYKAADLFDRCPTKVECVGEGYLPGADDVYTDAAGHSLVNSYHGPMYQPLMPTPAERELWAKFLTHLFPEGSPWLETYLDGLAFLIQNKGRRLSYMTVIAGERKGTGKTLLMHRVPSLLFGAMNVSAPDAYATDTTFTDYLHHKQIVCFDELFAGDSLERAEARMNARSAWISEDASLPIHPKGRKAYEARPNVVTFFATSNYPEKAVFIPPDDRRYALEETKAEEMPAHLQENFADVFLHSDRAAGVLAWILCERNISDFNPKKRPAQTRALVAARRASFSDLENEILSEWEDSGDYFKPDFGTMADLRRMLLRAGLRYMPSNYVLTRRLISTLRTVGTHVIRARAQALISGQANSRVWIWRNAVQWEHATAGQLAAEHERATKSIV
jgi:Family of unknown function (DUF5906)